MILKSGYSDNNVVAIIILFIIYLNIKDNKKSLKYGDKLYLFFIISTCLIMVITIFLDIISGSTGYLRREIHMILILLYFALSPFPFVIWALYANFYISKSIRKTKKIFPIIIIPSIINVVLYILSVNNKIIFFIDENNIYRRGDLYVISGLLLYIYFLALGIWLLRKRKDIREKDYYTLVTFIILPIIGCAFQMRNDSGSFIWLSITISALIIYLNIQNSEIHEDYLTGLYNRRQLDMYLKNSIREIKEDGRIFMIMIDINDFKSINDMYGHIEGDEALKHVADILTDSFRSEDFISRYAGDEFVIIINLEDKDYEKIISRLRRKFEEFNKSNITPYDISISLGYDIYNPELKMDADEFIKHVDKLMYEDKERSKKLD